MGSLYLIRFLSNLNELFGIERNIKKHIVEKTERNPEVYSAPIGQRSTSLVRDPVEIRQV